MSLTVELGRKTAADHYSTTKLSTAEVIMKKDGDDEDDDDK